MKKIFTLLAGLIFVGSVMAQNEPNDCVNAIVVCGNGAFSSNADGIGNIQEVAGCSSSEHNSLWIKINIVQSGTLGFTLIPDDPDINVDYDFWVYGPNRSCSNLGSPIRCNTTNPAAAGLSDNQTGMNNSNMATTGGPGASGTGYVFWLNVVAGQFYYIAIDRPVGDGGFQIQWNGTAMNGTGAFPAPPTANQIPDVVTCSVTPNVGIFDLNAVRSQINADLAGNTINFYTTYANAVDGIAPLPNIIGNTSNPQRIYAKVVNNVAGCSTITDFNLRVVQVPNSGIAVSDTDVCSGENVTVTITGPPNVTVEYKINGGAVQTALLGASGVFQFTETLSANTTYTLVRSMVLDTNNAIVCSQIENETVSVVSNALPTITGIITACQGLTTQLTGSGTPAAVSPWTSSDTSVATINATGLVTGVSVGSSTITYTNSNGCSTSTIVSVTALPTIAGSEVLCENSTTQLTGSGTPAVSNAWVSSDIAVATVNATGLVTGVSAGTTTITYTNNNGCTATASVTINALPTISGTLSACQGNTTQLTGSGTPAASNAWVSSNTSVATVDGSGLVTGVSAGTVTITYTNSIGCSRTATVVINALPTISGTLSACIASVSQLSGSDVPAAVNAWVSSNPGVATISASGLVSAITIGTTTITYTNNNGCSTTATFTVNDLPTVTGTNSICVTATTQLTGSGTPAASNPWTSSDTNVAVVTSNGIVAGIAAGMVTITYTNSNGCSNTRAVMVNALPVISGTLSACVGGTTQLTGSATPALSNAWSSSNTAVATVSTTGLVSGLSAGTTTITYTNTNGCQVTAVVIINALPTITGTLTACINGTTQLTGSGTPAASNAWVSSTTGVATVSGTGLVTGVAVGSTTITYTNSNGCSTATVIDVLSTPTATIAISGASTICTGTTTDITMSGTPNTTVSYTVNGTPATVSLPASGTVTFTTANLSAQTTYQLVSVSTGSGCSGVLTQAVVVMIAAQPTASISGTTTICYNSTASITFSGTPGATVDYTVNSGPIQTLTIGAGGNTVVVTGPLTADATYTLVNVIAGTIPNCIQPVTGSAIVTVVQTPTVTATPASESLCSGQSTGIQLQGTVPNTTFSWTYTQTGGVTGASNGSGNIISQVLTAGTSVGTVTYTITPTVGSCTGTPITVDVTVTPAPSLMLNTTSQSLCTGATTNITMSSTVGTTTFGWNVVQTGGVTGGTNGTGTAINDVLTVSGNTIGQAVYTITPLNNGCPGTPRTVTVTVYPTPVAMASPASETICSGQTTNIALTSTVPGTTFSWTVVQSGIFGASSGSGSVIAQTLSTVGLASGTVTYTITPTVNGCTGAPITVTVTVNPTPEVFSSSAPQFICSGESPGIIVNPNISGTSISWTVVQSGVTGASNGSGSETTPGSGIPIDQVLTATGTTQGTVTYTIIPENNGCSGNPITVVIKVNPLPNVQIPDGSICVDALTGDLVFGYTMDTGLNPADYDFQWYFGTDFVNIIGTGSSYVAEEAGDYTVSVMNMTTGCSDVFTIHVTETNPAHTPSAVVTNYFEDDQAITVTVIGNGTYEYELDHSGVWQTSNVFPHVLPGEHSVAIRDANGSGCTQLEIEHIFTIGYPHFFTPNGDGYNDYWNIKSLVGLGQGQAEIMIFDRYGKLIKQIVPIGEGWDGTFNGQLLPSTDYWFTVKYLENGTEKIFKAHFSLKR